MGYVRAGMVVKDGLLPSRVLKIGDKLGPMYGLKFTARELLPYDITVTSVVPEDEMPSIIDEVTGKEFKPNMLISTKNLARGLGGEIREMAAVTNMFDSIEAFRTKGMHQPRKAVVVSFEDQKRVGPRLPKGDVVVRGKRSTFTDTSKKVRTVRVTYGIIRVLQLRHITTIKHYPSTNCTSVVRDAIIMDNYVVLISCPVYNRTVIGWDCPYPKPPSTEKMVRYSMLVLAVFAEVYMYNTLNFVPLGIKFIM
ncbi:hypothetical protein Z517_09311 [Fonsecaea pedrosoi CBS 271.37]|uniref:Uncharacterized protein n=1 Tax=Fonsecaea pedrosoi CBS 271.37 TaxID=1442368 RepID=A0A0D2ERI5_9EURO|nr:uncharacterized protein Z517_09311 [Fonsecaea pedrosoi CBS 271.37]KIW76867.1 hypothetical protein Z517_09311 [Fonsecaea pedrosoi CBS 271.37]